MKGILMSNTEELHPRIDFSKVSPGAVAAMYGVERYVKKSGLEPTLLGLVKVRGSQINQCAFCIDMHTREARAHGATEQRLYGLTAWRETPFFTPRERAALAWTEALTLVSQDQVPDSVFELARKEFSESELVDLSMAVVAINGWNRLSIGFRAVPGSYVPAPTEQVASHA